MLRAYMDGGTGGGVEGEEGGGGGRLVALRGAILLADKVVTVSPSYAREILSAHGAFGLQLQVSC
jgi:glycogen synthase